MRKNAGHIVIEHQQTNALTKRNKMKLINLLADLIKEDYDDNATQIEIKSICQTVVTLFPSLADKAGGIVSFLAFLCVKVFNCTQFNHRSCYTERDTDFCMKNCDTMPKKVTKIKILRRMTMQ